MGEDMATKPRTRAKTTTLKAAPKPERLASLDAFRGFVILTMIFVNYIPGMKGTPSWLKHVKYGVDGYTITDLVFPGFLFIVGIAIPLALRKRMLSGGFSLSLLYRIGVRLGALLLLGIVVDINLGKYAAGVVGMPRVWFQLLVYLSIIGVWNIYPRKGTPGRLKLYKGLQLASGLLLIVLLAVFRAKTRGGEVVWLRHEWWGILGMIGWAYATCSIAYLLCRGNATALMGVLGFMIALFIGGQHGLLDFLGVIGQHINVAGLMGSTSAIVMAGVLVGILFTDQSLTSRARIKFMTVFGVSLYLAGQLIRPLHGINKISGTDAYSLVSAGICCLAFMVFYWVMDVLKYRRWASFLQPIGVNPLMAYILPAIIGCLIGIFGLWSFFWPMYGSEGIAGPLNGVVMTGLVLAATWGLTKLKLILKL
jgi:heparan-alpha-glucosaminide N-acetyltransferase